MDLETVFLALRVVVALAAVFGALFFLHRWLTKGRPGQARAKQIAVVARQGLGAKAGIAIVDAHGRRYLLGVTEHTVTVLDTLGPAESTAVALMSTAAVRIPGHFEQQLQEVDLGTGSVPVLVQGGEDHGTPITAAITLPPTSRRAMRQAEARRAAAEAPKATSPIAGSVISPATWRQTVTAIKQLR